MRQRPHFSAENKSLFVFLQGGCPIRGTRDEAHNKATTLLVRQRNRCFSARNDFICVLVKSLFHHACRFSKDGSEGEKLVAAERSEVFNNAFVGILFQAKRVTALKRKAFLRIGKAVSCLLLFNYFFI
jgi:hypothetical protein